MSGRGSVDVGWRRLLEGVVVSFLLVGLFVVLAGPSRVGSVLERSHPGLVAASLVAALLWLLAWSETLSVLYASHWPDAAGIRFRVAFLGGMGARGLVPGGSVSGPAVLAYVVTTSTESEAEGGVAMAYLAEFVYWLASMLVVGVGFVGVVYLGSPTTEVYTTATSILAVLLVVSGGVAVGARRPGLLVRPVRRTAALVRRPLSGRFPRAERALAPESVDRRIDRFRSSFARLAEQPRRVGPAFGAALLGWIANVFVLTTALAAVDAPVPAYVTLFVVPVAGFARTVSLLPGGIGGVAPAMTTLIVVLSPATLAGAGAAVLLYRLATFWFRLGIGAVCLVALGFVDVPSRRSVAPDAE